MLKLSKHCLDHMLYTMCVQTYIVSNKIIRVLRQPVEYVLNTYTY